ncbi:microsomal glutathione S-transferase 1-like [Hydractinia symbiolongicarpus]|uniref:microsomal glutathione S-transferase 1-like n=1 Tax=Hydractinia symbiolongicarpus TaxID=13093 RepID=UPI00255098F0|nr:microsomal glutathione S-transferase 1-like [Hydractinia symbiolongicarpus]XP_057309384.1 microsomal glutathione S-transferase 1-like [Hydractinia symbiolongicarpus]
MADIYSNENPLFKTLAFYVGVLILKMFFVQMYTTFQRITKNIYATEEDITFADPSGKKVKIDPQNPIVERIRRAHLNDIENIVPFIFLGIFYISTHPVYSTTLLVFRIFTAARFLHSFVYLAHVRQPFRVLSFGVGIAVNIFMAVSIVMFYSKV